MNLGGGGGGEGGGGGGDGGAVLLGALGLGSFARLDLPAPPDGLDIAAAVDLASGCIAVAMGGDRVDASPADVAAALALPLGPVALAPEVDAAVFSSPEAIATVRGFVHDRFLLGGGALPEEAVAALWLVEEGKAYAVDWGRLVWALLKREVLTGEPRRYSHYLLRLMKCQRPELSPFTSCLQQILDSVPNMENAIFDMERTFMDTQIEVQHLKEEVREKNNEIRSIVENIVVELQARHARVYQHEQDMQAMLKTFQEYKRLFEKSSATFLEYRKRMLCGEGGGSSLDAIGMADGQDRISWMQHQRAHQTINNSQKYWFSKYSACVDEITWLATRMTDLNHEVQRLKDSGSIPDLNNGGPQL